MSKKPITGVAQGKRARLITLRTLVRTQPPVSLHFGRFKEATKHNTTQHNTLNRCGAEGARRAHNPEVRCSNHLVGIITLCAFYRNAWSSWTLNAAKPVTGVAQRKRAGLITPRSQDQSLSPVLLHFGSFTEAVTHSTGVAHRQRAGLITLR